MYKYIHTCIYIHISCPHTYTHTHIYTHAYKMYIWTHAKHIWNDGAAATAREAQLDTKKLCPSPCPHHKIAPSRPHPLICTGAEQIHPVHCPRQLPAWPWPPETRSFFCHFGGVFRHGAWFPAVMSTNSLGIAAVCLGGATVTRAQSSVLSDGQNRYHVELEINVCWFFGEMTQFYRCVIIIIFIITLEEIIQ